MCKHMEMLMLDPLLRNFIFQAFADRGILHHQDLGRTQYAGIRHIGQIQILVALLWPIPTEQLSRYRSVSPIMFSIVSRSTLTAVSPRRLSSSVHR